MSKSIVGLFIDGANIYATAKALNYRLDYRRLKTFIETQEQELVQAYYYTAMVDKGEENNPVIPLVDWLGYNGYIVRTKMAKTLIKSNGQIVIKGNMDMEMAVDILQLAPYMRTAFIATGDGDFRMLAEALQRQGVQVNIISSIKTDPHFCADELRRQSNKFIDLYDIRDMTKQGDT